MRSLAWVVDAGESPRSKIERAYALDALYVYRREIDLSHDIPRPEYWRASHRDVLANSGGWGDLDPGIWTKCDENGNARGGVA